MAEEKPRFNFEINLRITRLNALKVQDPALLTDKNLDQAWNMLSDFVIGVLDEKGMEVDDEQLREIIIELCYWVAYREMFTLCVAPGWEQSWKDRLGTRKTGAKGVRQKSPYDDEWGSV